MTVPPYLTHPLARADLKRAATELNRGSRRNSISQLALVTGTPIRTMRAYASGERPIPRHLVAALRTLFEIQELVAKREEVIS